jgi:hypothetical protein
MSQSAVSIAQLRQRKQRLMLMRGLMVPTEQVAAARPAVMLPGERGMSEAAFALVDKVSSLLSGRLPSVKSLQSGLSVLRDMKTAISKRAKSAFFELFQRDGSRSLAVCQICSSISFPSQRALRRSTLQGAEPERPFGPRFSSILSRLIRRFSNRFLSRSPIAFSVRRLYRPPSNEFRWTTSAACSTR